MNYSKIILIFISTFLSISLAAKPVQSFYKGLTLNANWQDMGKQQSTAFLILHGTWATHKMELPSKLQELLAEQGYSSLSITLSLNINNRTKSPDCNNTLTSGHTDNLDEINHWLSFMKNKGYENIILVGHSAGGSQIANFSSTTKDLAVKAQVLIAPMVWSASDMPIDAVNLAKTTQQDIIGPVKLLFCDSAMVTAKAYQSYYLSDPVKNTPTLISTTKLPTYVYLGSEDKRITSNFMQQKALFQSNKAVTVKIIDGAEHFFRDLYAEDIIDDLIETLQ